MGFTDSYKHTSIKLVKTVIKETKAKLFLNLCLLELTSAHAKLKTGTESGTTTEKERGRWGEIKIDVWEFCGSSSSAINVK